MSSSGQLLVQPVSMPAAAGIDFAGGDVRHLSSTADPLSGAAVAASTRQLAQRDNILAEKVNELVSAVNNKDQIINLPLIVTVLPASSTQVVTNYRIPAGFQARILDAAVSSVPSNSVQLSIGYNANTFGQTTSQVEIVSTLSEDTTGTSFYNTGEFVVSLINTSGQTATATASIILTMQPAGAVAGGLIGPGVTGEPGPVGPPGPPGMNAVGTPGPAGPAGLTSRGTYAGTATYNPRDWINYNGSSWSAPTPVTPGNPPPLDPTQSSASWTLLAAQGAAGPPGTGPKTTAGRVMIPSGSDFVNVTFSPSLSAVPIVVPGIEHPVGGDNLWADIRSGFTTTLGFIADINAPVSASGYFLTYTATTP